MRMLAFKLSCSCNASDQLESYPTSQNVSHVKSRPKYTNLLGQDRITLILKNSILTKLHELPKVECEKRSKLLPMVLGFNFVNNLESIVLLHS